MLAGVKQPVVVDQIGDSVLQASNGTSVIGLSSIGDGGVKQKLLPNGSLLAVPGQVISISGSGMSPLSTTEVWLYSTPKMLGTAEADSSGQYEVLFSLPTDLEKGSHKVQAEGTALNGDELVVALGITISTPEVVLANSEGRISYDQAKRLVTGSFGNVMDSHSDMSLVLYVLVFFALVGILVASVPVHKGRDFLPNRLIMDATPWLRGKSVARLLVLIVGLVIGVGMASSANYFSTVPSTIWVLAFILIATLDIVSGIFAASMFVSLVLISGGVNSMVDAQLLTALVAIGIAPVMISIAARKRISNIRLAFVAAICFHLISILAIAQLPRFITGLSFNSTDNVGALFGIGVIAIVLRQILTAQSGDSDEETAGVHPAFQAALPFVLGFVALNSRTLSAWSLAAFALIVGLVLIGLLPQGFQEGDRYFRPAIKLSVLTVCIVLAAGTGVFGALGEVTPLSDSVVPVSQTKVIGDIEVDVNGFPQTFTLSTIDEHGISVSSSSFELSLSVAALDSDSKRIPLDLFNSPQLIRGERIELVALGLAPNSLVEAWLYSNPIQLGDAESDSAGKITTPFEIPTEFEIGRHVLQIRAFNAAGESVHISMDVVVGDSFVTPGA